MINDPEFFSIGEFSQITGLSVKTLRFYDEKRLLQPPRVDTATGYRYYNGASVDRARMIARLRELQFSLDDIQRLLAECEDDAQLMESFARQIRTIRDRIKTDQKTAKLLESAIADEAEAARLATAGRFRIETKEIGPMPVAGLRMTGRYEECGRGFKTLARTMARHIAGKAMCLYYDSEFRDDDANFEPCFPLRREVAAPEGVSVKTLPPSRCLTLVHQGPYNQLGRSYKIVLSELRRRELRATLPTREVYLKGPGMIFRGNPGKYLTEIQIPLIET
jgi:DNA-binding transcriptional MerR regulator/effector-binding domain-containing protein